MKCRDCIGDPTTVGMGVVGDSDELIAARRRIAELESAYARQLGRFEFVLENPHLVEKWRTLEYDDSMMITAIDAALAKEALDAK